MRQCCVGMVDSFEAIVQYWITSFSETVKVFIVNTFCVHRKSDSLEFFCKERGVEVIQHDVT